MTLESGATLRYVLALPNSFSPAGFHPLIVALHYGGQVTPFYGRRYLTGLVLPAFRELAGIIVAPDCPGNGWTDPLSEKAVLELLRQVQKDYPVNSQRLVLTGYSLGAIGTWDIVFKHPQLFSAAIPVSGMPPKGIIVRPPDTHFWVIHSLKDELFPVESVRKFIQFCQSQGVSVRFSPIAGLSHYEFSTYVPALKKAVPWVRSLWKTGPSSGRKGGLQSAAGLFNPASARTSR